MFMHGRSQVHGQRRRIYSNTVDSYHRPSPSISSEGMDIGNPTKKVTTTKNSNYDGRDLKVQHDAHCMGFALHLWKEI